MNLKKEKYLCCIFGGIIGIVSFIAIYGIKILNPTYDEWIFNQNGDMVQHQIGWMFFRNSDWSFPLGIIDGLSETETVTCVVTDCLPLFAIFFKLFSPLLPETFQYFGIWALICYIMQGVLSAAILRKLTSNTLFSLVGTIFFTTFSAVIERFYHHDTLMAHWLILLAVFSFVYQNRKWKYRITPIIIWLVNGMLAVMIHSYFLPMIYMVMLGYIIVDVFENKKYLRPVTTFLSTTVCSVATMYVIGGFADSGSMSGGGLGIFSANLNAFFNSFGDSKFLKPLNITGQQKEGYGYLGLGVILLCIIAIMLILYHTENKNGKLTENIKGFIKAHKIKITAISVIIISSMYFAVFPRVTLNGRVLYTINYPDKIHDLLSIFRASGRFIWVTDYFIILIALFILSRLRKSAPKTIMSVLLFCIGVQLLDFSEYIKQTRNKFTTDMTYSLSSEFKSFNSITDSKKEFIFIPPRNSLMPPHKDLYEFAYYSSENDMQMSMFYLARNDNERLSKYISNQLELLEKNEINENAVYVFYDKTMISDKLDNIETYDFERYTLLTAK